MSVLDAISVCVYRGDDLSFEEWERLVVCTGPYQCKGMGKMIYSLKDGWACRLYWMLSVCGGGGYDLVKEVERG